MWSSLLSGHVFIQIHLDTIDGIAQVVADVGTHVVTIQTQGCGTGLVCQRSCLLTQTTAQNRKYRLFKEI